MTGFLLLTAGEGVQNLDPVLGLWRSFAARRSSVLASDPGGSFQPGFYEFRLFDASENIAPGLFALASGADGPEAAIAIVCVRSGGAILCYGELRDPVAQLRLECATLSDGGFYLRAVACRKMSWMMWRARCAIARARAIAGRHAPFVDIAERIATRRRNEGWEGVRARLAQVSREEREKIRCGLSFYRIWSWLFQRVTSRDRREIAARIAVLPTRPTFSIVMPVFNPPALVLEQAIASVQRQLYPHWELCIADDASTKPHVRAVLEVARIADARIKIVYRESNGHISAASNSALALASGDFIALLDHDDELTEHALYWMAEYINLNPRANILYSDEDKIDAKGRAFDPHFKPEWNEHLFFAYNMISHFGVYRSSLMRELGGFREGFEGSQDYDLALRCIERSKPDEIVHVPYILYHWRAVEGSAATKVDAKSYVFDATHRALNEHFTRRGLEGEVVAQPDPQVRGIMRPKFRAPQPAPSVSIIIPTRNKPELLRACVESLLAHTTYENYNIIVVDNQSDDRESIAYLDFLAANPRIRVLRYDYPFNFSAINNFAVSHTQADIVCLLNNDTQIIEGDWLTEMVSHAARPEIGAVGARLFYPDRTLQHAGVIVGTGGVAGHCFHQASGYPVGYSGRAAVIMELSAVTGACMVMRREVYRAAGGLDEAGFSVAFNDIDLCLQIRELGLRNLYTPFANLIHHESKSRGYEDTREKQRRFSGECALFKRRWAAWTRADPAFNPNFSLASTDFELSSAPRAPKVWRKNVAFYQPAGPLADRVMDAPGRGLCAWTRAAPAFLGEKPLRVLDFSPGFSEGRAMRVDSVTVDGWQSLAPDARIAATWVARLTGWAYVGDGESLAGPAWARLSRGEEVLYLALEPAPHPRLVAALGQNAARDAGFSVRILPFPAGNGPIRVDILQNYQTFAADIRGVAVIEFFDADEV